MTCPRCPMPCGTDREMDNCRSQNDDPALAPVGLCEPGLSAMNGRETRTVRWKRLHRAVRESFISRLLVM